MNITRSAVRKIYQRYEEIVFFIVDKQQEEVALQMNEMIVLLPEQLYEAVASALNAIQLQQLQQERILLLFFKNALRFNKSGLTGTRHIEEILADRVVPYA